MLSDQERKCANIIFQVTFSENPLESTKIAPQARHLSIGKLSALP
jgi:hypothetical protein